MQATDIAKAPHCYYAICCLSSDEILMELFSLYSSHLVSLLSSLVYNEIKRTIKKTGNCCYFLVYSILHCFSHCRTVVEWKTNQSVPFMYVSSCCTWIQNKQTVNYLFFLLHLCRTSEGDERDGWWCCIRVCPIATFTRNWKWIVYVYRSIYLNTVNDTIV